MGRIPLHYVNSTSNPKRNWQLLVENGSPVDIKDTNGRTPDFYLNDGDDIRLPGKVRYSELDDEGIVVKPSNIRIWIHDQDIAHLREVIWQGHGDKLRTQTSNKASMKKFLNAVPYVMTVIREIHRAAIENKVDILASWCRPPVPAVILKSKDDKGIIALHKACGLGNAEVVDYILQTYPEAIHIRDCEGRTAIHYAASFKREHIYEKLLKSGANEHLIDKNGKTAKYYRSKRDDMKDVEWLRELPSSPRTGPSAVDGTFDWSIFGSGPSSVLNRDAGLSSYTDLFLQANGSSPATAAAIDGESVASDTEFSVLAPPSNGESESRLSEERQTPTPGPHSPPDSAVAAQPSSVFSDEAATLKLDSDQLSEAADRNAETPDVEFEFTQQDYSAENEATNLSRRPENDEKMDDEPEYRGDTAGQGADSASGTADTEEAQVETVQLEGRPTTRPEGTDGAHSIDSLSSRKWSDDETELKAAVENVVRNENLQEIGKFVTAGHGEWLLGVKSENRTIRELVDHLPIYLKKIELIHRCCEIGNLEELRKSLDRRKFAIACENKSSLFLTPLHVAVARNRIDVVRYLGSRFPETLHQPDKLGRTPLHYAAMLADGKFAYNMLLTLGANKSLKDHNGYSAQFYYDNPKQKYHEELSEIVEKLASNSPKRTVKREKTSLIDELAFDQNDSKYLASVLCDALKSGLFAVARTKPLKPIKFLADHLSNYKTPQLSPQKTVLADKPNTAEEMKLEKDFPDDLFLVGSKDSQQISNEKVDQEKMREGEGPQEVEQIRANQSAELANATMAQSLAKEYQQHRESEQNLEKAAVPEENKPALNYDPASNVFLPSSRDEYGRTAVHLAASKKQSRNSLLQMLQELKANVAYRDELYRTARDVAALSQIYENVKTIDEYVVYIAANGETDKIINLLTDGYDHILETETEEDILTVAERRNHRMTLNILKTIPIFENMRERLHEAIRQGDKMQVMEMLRKCGKDAALMAISKSEMCRCSLHIAILAQRKDIAKYLVKKFPTTLHIGDNLERTPLHYAMALERVEEFSTILTRAGAQRTAKDLKGRQPTYYFVNKDEILRMQQEEIYLNQNIENRSHKKP